MQRNAARAVDDAIMCIVYVNIYIYEYAHTEKTQK